MKLSNDLYLEISFVKEKQVVYIGTPESCGEKYNCETIDDLKETINEYVEDYIVNIEYDENNKEYEEIER